MPGPSRTPQALRLARGTARPDRVAAEPLALPIISELPPPPEWLTNPHAIAEWKRLGSVLAANKLLTEGGLSAFAMLCALHGRLVGDWSAGVCPTGHMLAQYRNMVNDFRLTPVAQGKVKPIGKKPDANPFARNGKP